MSTEARRSPTRFRTICPSLMSTNPYQPPQEVEGNKSVPALAIARRTFSVAVWIASALVLLYSTAFLVMSAGDLSTYIIVVGLLFVVLPAVGGIFIGLGAWLPRLWCVLLGLGLLSPFVLLQLFHELPGF